VRLTWGVPAARRIWPTLSNLPAPPAATPPDPHAEARAELVQFLEEATVQKRDAKIAASRLYNAYSAWCATAGDGPSAAPPSATACRSWAGNAARPAVFITVASMQVV